MHASSSFARRRFAQFDEELQDSDQTISRPVRHRRPRARLPILAESNGCSTRPVRHPFPTSAFFSDSTDDDMSCPLATTLDRSQLSMSACNLTTHRNSSRKPPQMSAGPSDGQRGTRPVARLHLEAIEFPMTRSVLWDRRSLSAAPIKVSLEQILPHFIVSAEALKEIYKLYGEKSGEHGTCAALCFLYGDTPSVSEKRVLLQGVKTTEKDAKGAGTWRVPVYINANEAKSERSRENYVGTIKAVQNSYRDEHAASVSSKLQPKLFVFRSSSHAAQLEFQLECVASPLSFKYTLVRNLPLLMTPLAASLAKREFDPPSGNVGSGYLTLDRTRKAVPLLKIDPLVLQHPVVGIWVYGIQIDDDWEEATAQRQLADPFLYFACIGYLMSEVIKERVGPNNNTFLVALYPADNSARSAVVSSLPRFFECSLSECTSPLAMPFPLALCSHRRSCLVGVSRVLSDVEFILTPASSDASEEARRQSGIPTALCSSEVDAADHTQPHNNVEKSSQEYVLTPHNITSVGASEERNENVTSGWTIPADALRQNAFRDTSAQNQSSVSSEKAATPVQDDRRINGNVLVTTNLDDQHDSLRDTKAWHESTIGETESAVVPAQRECTRCNTNSIRSCCKSQQLLTIQHQQILENQQKQLHEMQGQISQLRRLLHATKSGTYHGDQEHASINNSVSNLSTGALAHVSVSSSVSSKQGDGDTSPQLSVVVGLSQPCSSDSVTFSTDTDHGNENDKEKGEEENMDEFLSSLDFSVISSGSDADLSLQSSLLVSEEGKQARSLGQRGNEPADVKESDPEGTISTQFQELKSSANKLEVTQPSAFNESCDSVRALTCSDQERDDAKTILSAHKLSTAELNFLSTPVGTNNADSIVIDQEVDDALDAAAETGDCILPADRLLLPDAYLRTVGGFVDHHGGCFTTPPLDFHSFCVPRIKFSTETPGFLSDSEEDEEIRLIEQKYKRLMAT